MTWPQFGPQQRRSRSRRRHDRAGSRAQEALPHGFAERAAVTAAADMDNLEVLERLGYVVVEHAIPDGLVDEIADQLAPHLTGTRLGRTQFEGVRTERVYSLLAKVPAVAALVDHPLIVHLLDRLLLPNSLISSLLAINLHPGEVEQPIHYDDGFYILPSPRPLCGISVIWSIDPFTSDNGATEVIPGSHHLDPQPPNPLFAEPVEMRRGSALVMLGTLWHRGGANNSDSPRLAISAQYCQPWARQQENMTLAVPPTIAGRYSSRIQAMLGYSIHQPFMGHVDGMHPLRLVDPRYAEQSSVERQRSAEFWERRPAPT